MIFIQRHALGAYDIFHALSGLAPRHAAGVLSFDSSMSQLNATGWSTTRPAVKAFAVSSDNQINRMALL
jgi:hypothetical protein